MSPISLNRYDLSIVKSEFKYCTAGDSGSEAQQFHQLLTVEKEQVSNTCLISFDTAFDALPITDV